MRLDHLPGELWAAQEPAHPELGAGGHEGVSRRVREVHAVSEADILQPRALLCKRQRRRVGDLGAAGESDLPQLRAPCCEVPGGRVCEPGAEVEVDRLRLVAPRGERLHEGVGDVPAPVALALGDVELPQA